MSSIYPTTVGLTSSSHLHDPENLGYRALHRLVIYRIIELLHRDDDLDIIFEFESESDSSSVERAEGASNHDDENIASNHGNLNNPSKGNQNTSALASSSPMPYEEKIERLVDAIMDGRRLTFSPSADNDGYTVYAMQSPRLQQVGDANDNLTSENGMEQQISAHPINFGNVIATFSSTAISEPLGPASGSAAPSEHPKGLGHVVTSAGRVKTPYPGVAALDFASGSAAPSEHLKDPEQVVTSSCRPATPYPVATTEHEIPPNETVTTYLATYAPGGSTPDNEQKFQSILEWSTTVQDALAKSAASGRDGRFLVYMGQGGVECDEVDPVPFDIRKKARCNPGTPVVSSHGSILDTSSPSFVKTCKGIVKQSYLDVATALVPATIVPVPVVDEKGKGVESNLPDVWSDPGNPGSPGNPEGLSVWEDIEDDDVLSDDGNQASVLKSIVPNYEALRDTTNLRRPGYLKYNAFYQDTMAVGQDVLTMNARAPSSATQHKPARVISHDWAITSPTSFVTARDRPGHASNFVEAFAALEGVVISESPVPQGSLSLTPPPLGLHRTVQLKNTLAVLEGRISRPANTPSPLHRVVRPASLYNGNVYLDNPGPRLRHPQPLSVFDEEAVLARMEQKVMDGIELRGGFAEGRLIKRPSNPTPIRARFHDGEGFNGHDVVRPGRLYRTSPNPIPLRVRYQLGEASSA
ncbi:MAG: hypothetical protein LQ347_003487 [Umbilicaria vellea]|nr:MAG: hypothetical protein LQ347_003487 [Umbilicaria vellea]